MTAPRNVTELKNVTVLLREATSMLDLEQSLRSDERTFKLADRLYDLLCDARELLELYQTESGHHGYIEPTIAIKNNVKV